MIQNTSFQKKVVYLILIALLMVSRIPYPHVITQILRGRRSFSHVVVLVFTSMAVLTVRWYAIPILCCLYTAIPALRYGWSLMRRSQQPSASSREVS